MKLFWHDERARDDQKTEIFANLLKNFSNTIFFCLAPILAFLSSKILLSREICHRFGEG